MRLEIKNASRGLEPDREMPACGQKQHLAAFRYPGIKTFSAERTAGQDTVANWFPAPTSTVTSTRSGRPGRWDATGILADPFVFPETLATVYGGVMLSAEREMIV